MKTNALQRIYNLNNVFYQLLEDAIDTETGEIKDNELYEYLESIKEEGVQVAGKGILALKSQSEIVNAEIKRLKEIKDKIDKTQEALERYLHKYEGHTFEFDTFKIGWRKSSVVEVDDFDFDIEKVEKQYPELVEVKKTLKKSEVKNLTKQGLPLPEGVKIVEKLNLQIK